jgi:hypothetical protein
LKGKVSQLSKFQGFKVEKQPAAGNRSVYQLLLNSHTAAGDSAAEA